MQQTYRVWAGKPPGPQGVGLNERCLLTVDGDYIGIQTGQLYLHTTHYHSVDLKAVVISADQENKTGMIHLSETNTIFGVNKKDWKSKYIGCCVTVNKAHMYDGKDVYYCQELSEYFSETELSVDQTPATIL